MNENKRFTLTHINEQHLSANLYDDKTFIGSIGIGAELIVELLNDLSEENDVLKQQLKELQEFKDNYDKNMELIHNSDYVQDFLNGNL